MKKILLHGSKIQGLKRLVLNKEDPKKSIYAISELAFAVIFIHRPGGSLVMSIGRLNKIPYICERKEGVINKNYKGISGSIYVVDKKYFHQEKGMWKEEWLAKKTVPVLEEIKIDDLQKYLQQLEKKKQLKIIYYKDRLKYFPNIDKELFKQCIDLIKKYGKDKIIQSIEKHQPQILDKVLKVAKNSSSMK